LNLDIIQTFLIFFLALSTQFQPVAADAGDVIAGILLTIIALIAICAGLGWYSRRTGASATTEI